MLHCPVLFGQVNKLFHVLKYVVYFLFKHITNQNVNEIFQMLGMSLDEAAEIEFG